MSTVSLKTTPARGEDWQHWKPDADDKKRVKNEIGSIRLRFLRKLAKAVFILFDVIATATGGNTSGDPELQRLPASLATLRFHLTPKDFMAFLPPAAEKGDHLFCIVSCPVLMVLREIPGKRFCYRVIGNAFIKGMRNEEDLVYFDHELDRDNSEDNDLWDIRQGAFQYNVRMQESLQIDVPKTITLI